MAADAVADVWRQAALATDTGARTGPGLLMMHGRHLVDLSHIETLEQAQALVASEVAGFDGDTQVALVGVRGR